jgi:very-short-patch-repair endonuclease
LTLVDLAGRLDDQPVERAVNEADRLDLIDPSALREALDAYAGWRGVARLRELLDRRTFRLTDSELERLFLPLAAHAGLPLPLTRQNLNGFRVDFLWPELRLVVETDGLRYHRTPAQQARDRLRDQTHLAAGFTPLRFTHAQVRYEAKYVRSTLRAVARRLEKGSNAASL